MPASQSYGTPQIMPVVGGNGGNSALNWINMRDLRPVNEAGAVLSGAMGGSAVGGLAGFVAFPLLLEEGLQGQGVKALLNSSSMKVFAGVTLAATVIGGLAGYLHAHTHNKWAEKTQDQMMEQQKLEIQARSGNWVDRSQQVPAGQALGV